MKLTIEFKDPKDFEKLMRMLRILQKDIFEFGFELEADFRDYVEIVDFAHKQLQEQYEGIND